jgi:anti-sigma factor RsiW
MPADPTHVSLEAELPLHAIGALDADAANAVEEHLVSCAQCRGALAGYRSATALLSPTTRRSLDAAWTSILDKITVGREPTT